MAACPTGTTGAMAPGSCQLRRRAATGARTGTHGRQNRCPVALTAPLRAKDVPEEPRPFAKMRDAALAETHRECGLYATALPTLCR